MWDNFSSPPCASLQPLHQAPLHATAIAKIFTYYNLSCSAQCLTSTISLAMQAALQFYHSGDGEVVGRIKLGAGAHIATRGVSLYLDAVRHVEVVYSSTAVFPDISAVLLPLGIWRTLAGIAHVRRKLEGVCRRNFLFAPAPAVERAPGANRRRLANVKRVL